MKMTVFAILTGCVTGIGLCAEDAQSFKDDKEKASYALGVSLGNNWKRLEIQPGDLDFDQLGRGLKTVLGGDKPLLTEQEGAEILKKFQQDLTVRQQERRKQIGEKNKKEGDAFLAENKNKPGVLTLGTNGLQYKVITEGSGDIPKAEDTVTVNYRGTLIDGTEFDSSAKAGKPYTTRVTGVIPGWTEALKQMRVGSKWQLFIPSELAYRDYGRPPSIGPSATLIFEVELLSIQPPPPPVANAAPLTSDIIKVPSLEEMKKGAKIETIKAEDVEKLQKQQQEKEKEKQKPK